MERLNRRLRRHTLSLLLTLGALSPSLASAETMRQVFLVQNSGWMEPFYLDPSSPFKSLLGQLIGTAAGDTEVVLGSFNQADAQHPSPAWLYRGPGNHTQLQTNLKQLTLARKASGAYADTDFKEALLGAIQTALEGREGIVWIVTNNKNSPNNSSETQALNREFYNLLHHEAVISRIAAFPQKMPVKGPNYQANGLMIYALAYGEKAGAELERVLAQPALGQLLSDDRVRLKPLTEAAVRFVPIEMKDTPGVSAQLASDGQTLILSFNADSSQKTATLIGVFENQFNPYQIQTARVGMHLDIPGESLASGISVERIEQLDPGERSVPLEISLQLPPLPSLWSNEVLFSSGYQRSGRIEVDLSEQQLRIAPKFIERMSELFPGDALPDVFIPPGEVRASATHLPLVLRINHPIGPLLALLGGGLLLLGLAVFGLLLLTGRKTAGLLVEGELHKLQLKPFSQVDVHDARGEKVATLKRGLGATRITWQNPDVAVRLK